MFANDLLYKNICYCDQNNLVLHQDFKISEVKKNGVKPHLLSFPQVFSQQLADGKSPEQVIPGGAYVVSGKGVL